MKRELAWECSQLSLLDQTRTRDAWGLSSESLHESFLNFHCLIKREQVLHEGWQARVYMRVSSTFIAWSNENKSFIHENWQARVHAWEFQLSLLDQTRTRVHGMRVDKREFTWEFSQLSLLDQTRTRVAWEFASESLHENFLNFHCLFKREQEFHTWELTSEGLREWFNFHCLIKREQSCMRANEGEFIWKFSQLSVWLVRTRTWILLFYFSERPVKFSKGKVNCKIRSQRWKTMSESARLPSDQCSS
jgi:hypothetical protein